MTRTLRRLIAALATAVGVVAIATTPAAAAVNHVRPI